MNHVLIVFESMYGNNQQVASAIADGLRSVATVDLVEVGQAPFAIPAETTLLLVGGPNHAFGLSRVSDRDQAARRTDAPLVSPGIGLREWFETLGRAPRSIPAAGYDTRLAKPRFLRWFDRAARGIEKRLRAHGFEVVRPAEHFYVVSATGPLADGELDHARRWGQELGTMLVATPPAVMSG